MTGAREAGVLLGQSRAREARQSPTADRPTLALERIAEALEGIEVSLAVLADSAEELLTEPPGEDDMNG